MKKVSLSGSRRENVGRKDAKMLRKNGRIPAVMYGGKEQIHFSLEEKAFDKTLETPESFIYEIDIDGEKHRGVIYEIQFHPVTDRVLHVDFRQANEGEKVRAEIPFRLKGVAPGVTEGGRLYQKTRKLTIEGVVDKMPEYIDIDISNMKIGDKLHVRDLQLDDFKILTSPSTLVLAIVAPRKMATVVDLSAEEEEAGESAPAAE